MCSGTVEDQNKQIQAIVTSMVEKKRAYWSTTPVTPKEWPGPTLFLAMPGGGESGEAVPRIWRVRLGGEASDIAEIDPHRAGHPHGGEPGETP